MRNHNIVGFPDRLTQAIGMGPREQQGATPLEAVDLRKKEAEAAMAEQRAAIMRGDYIKKEIEKWSRDIRQAGIEPE